MLLGKRRIRMLARAAWREEERPHPPKKRKTPENPVVQGKEKTTVIIRR